MTQIKHERSFRFSARRRIWLLWAPRLNLADFSVIFTRRALGLHEIFFSEQFAAMALILAMGTYGAGYIARIIGAFVW